MVLPPVEAGAVQETVAEPLPVVALTPVGAPGLAMSPTFTVAPLAGAMLMVWACRAEPAGGMIETDTDEVGRRVKTAWPEAEVYSLRHWLPDAVPPSNENDAAVQATWTVAPPTGTPPGPVTFRVTASVGIVRFEAED